MKIVFNTYPVAFQCPGGGEIQLEKSRQALEQLGHDVVLFDQWSTDLSSADVVHHFSVQGGSSNFCGYVKNQNIPLVISPILWLSDYIDQYPMEEIGHLLAIGDVICPNSNQETERFLSHFDVPRDKFIVTRNGVDRRFYQPSQAAMFRKHFDIEGGFILCVGNIEERKNQHRLAMAAAAIDMPLVLIGHVRDQGYFDHLMQSAGNNTQYLGALKHDDPLLQSAYQACSVFALPSLLETPGLAALEALVSGSKLVITSEGCTEEYFGEYAHYVSPLDVNAIADGINSALLAPAPVISEDIDFSWHRTAKELEQAYIMAIAKTK